jgi:hypothetical protein
MELNLTELDNSNTMNSYETFDVNSYNQNELNYWKNDNNKNDIKPKKKKVSFNDILTNMNLVVNKEGILQFMSPTEEQFHNQHHNQSYNHNQPPQQIYNQSQPQMYKNVQYQTKNENQESLEPIVKHSYIFNKYFKDYVDPNKQKPEPRVPKTIEEYYKMLLDDKIRINQQKIRINEIKSKKMIFLSPEGAKINPRNIQVTRNNLRSMNFR